MQDKKKRTSMYDLPFEKRIRIKYTILGALFVCVGITFLAMVGNTLTIVLMNVFPDSLSEKGWQTTLNYQWNQFILSAMGFTGSGILLAVVWFDNSKPKKHPELDETVGLKSDWDKVNSI